MAGHGKITILGTGSAFVTRCFNTCFILDSGTTKLLVDAGGGNSILSRLADAGMQTADVRHMFLTHAHTDHVMGAVWVVRAMVNAVKKGKFDGKLKVYGHQRVINVLTEICRLTFSGKDFKIFGEHCAIDVLADGDERTIGDIRLKAFDIQSTKEPQFGFRATMPDGQTVVCLGDEPFNEANRTEANNADWLLTEAFCLHRDVDTYKPYEKHHSTALDAGRVAAGLRAHNLVIYHTEDNSLPTRRLTYTEEAARNFSGRIFVPDDMEVIEL